jgi:hypothetical protein
MIYYGTKEGTANAKQGTYRTELDGSTSTDITPAIDGNPYGPRFGLFGIRAYDSDRRYVAMVGQTSAAAVGGDAIAAFVSTNYGDTWATIVTPLTSGARPAQIAFAGNTEQVLYLWGFSGYIAYSQNFGGTIDDRSGNISSLGTPGEFLGIAGGD